MGNLYVADFYNNVVEKITPDGTLSIVAGTGTNGAPTAGPATSSNLGFPAGVAIDGDGNLYIADNSNNMIEKVTTDGTLSIIAGTGAAGAPTPGPATMSSLNQPSGVTVDGRGNVFIADYFNNLVDKVTPEGVLSIFAGNGTYAAVVPGPSANSPLGYPIGVRATTDGHVYVADYFLATIESVVQPRLSPTQPLNVAATRGDSQASVTWDTRDP